MEQKVAVPEVPLLKTIRKEEFAELADSIQLLITQDGTKRWLDYMGREVSALIQILTVKVLDDIKDINYIRGIIMGLNMATIWPQKVISRRDAELAEKEKKNKKENAEKKNKRLLAEKQSARQKRVGNKFKGGK